MKSITIEQQGEFIEIIENNKRIGQIATNDGANSIVISIYYLLKDLLEDLNVELILE